MAHGNTSFASLASRTTRGSEGRGGKGGGGELAPFTPRVWPGHQVLLSASFAFSCTQGKQQKSFSCPNSARNESLGPCKASLLQQAAPAPQVLQRLISGGVWGRERKTSTQEMTIRLGHYSGLTPIVRVYFREPVNPVRQKQELLRIEMKTAPYRMNDSATCDSEEVCRMFWFVPMPFMNGSVMHRVLVKSNGLGIPVYNRMFDMNIHGFMEPSDVSDIFRIGKKVICCGLNDPSRPLWATYRQAPVLILGGIPEKKIVVISDTNFDTYDLIEVAIDSCWIGSLSCPQRNFSSSIVDTIATESTLFIRQNQLVYYFTGHYSILHQETKGSDLWTRILNNVCVRRLLPVFFPHNNTEYVIALSGGFQQGEFFLISCKGGCIRSLFGPLFSFSPGAPCLITWVSLTEENKFYLLVMHRFSKKSYISSLNAAENLSFDSPLFFSTASDKGFVMLLGTEAYSRTALIARGLAYNPFSRSFYIWGNVILLSQDMTHYIYLSNFPRDSPIKDFVLSFTGSFAIMTDREEKKACKTADNVFSVSSGKDYIRFTHLCPFGNLLMVDLPCPQLYTREEYYWATPPDIMEQSGFHHKDSLTVYQGLVYQLLQLHSAYHRPYADPVHDPTWRWWKNQKEEAEYFSYKASNWKSLGGIYVEMANYAKVYNVMPDNSLPKYIYLDKNTVYSFNVFLTTRSARESSEEWLGETSQENSLYNIWMAVILAHPEYIEAKAQREELISRGSMLYRLAHFLFGPQGTDTVEIHIGCPPGKRLAFDITYTKNYTTEKNKHYFDCVEADPEMPCFYFSDVFYPFFLIQDMVTGFSGRFQGRFQTQRYEAANCRILPGPKSPFFPPFRWICQKNSPCYDIVPQSMATPDYFFVIKVSNRGVDQTTYCDYALEFIVHIHGLRLSPARALYVMQVRQLNSFIGYILLAQIWPKPTLKQRCYSAGLDRFSRTGSRNVEYFGEPANPTSDWPRQPHLFSASH
uniref:Cation channel sperm associated auxiliary subunit gamma n=1 Tax=Pseudonaja textilis TaxID=8673 RepID=A0A670ZXR5_PSETE